MMVNKIEKAIGYLHAEPYRGEHYTTILEALKQMQEREKKSIDEQEGRLKAIFSHYKIGMSDRVFLRDLLYAWESQQEAGQNER